MSDQESDHELDAPEISSSPSLPLTHSTTRPHHHFLRLAARDSSHSPLFLAFSIRTDAFWTSGSFWQEGETFLSPVLPLPSQHPSSSSAPFSELSGMIRQYRQLSFYHLCRKRRRGQPRSSRFLTWGGGETAAASVFPLGERREILLIFVLFSILRSTFFSSF